MELSTVYHSQTGGKSEREGYPIIIGGTSYKMNEIVYIWILRWFKGFMRLLELEPWLLISQNKWKIFIELEGKNVEFQVEECIFFKVSPWEKGRENKASYSLYHFGS